MATKIEWAKNADGTQGATWNPVRGCSRISEGCRNCYAERMAARFCGVRQNAKIKSSVMQRDKRGLPLVTDVQWTEKAEPFHGFSEMTPSGPRWTGRVELIPEMLDIPLRRKKPTTYFVNSMSDLFHESLPDEAIDQVFAVMALCPQHTFQVLTKRAREMREYFSDLKYRQEVIGIDAEYRSGLDRYLSGAETEALTGCGDDIIPRWTLPLPNVWLGVSVEDQKHKPRIDHLRETPAAIRFLSLEPLLEDLGELDLRGISWVIVGGESGPGARPMHPDWARSIRNQCQASGVKFFFKQQGEWQFGSSLKRSQDRVLLNDGTLLKSDAEDATEEQRENWFRYQPNMVARVGKKAAGRLLDGRTWDEMPEAAQC